MFWKTVKPLLSDKAISTTRISLINDNKMITEDREVANILNMFFETGFVSCGASLPSWGEGAFLALVGHPSSDGVTLKIPYGLDVSLHQPALHSIFSYWVG